MPIAADLYYNVYQGGGIETPSIVLIHGAGGTHLYWPSEVRRLAGYRVLALDLPGHGKSDGRGQQSISAYVHCVLNWLEAVGLHQAVFVGHSMGGAIALELAVDYPEHVFALGLVSTGARLWVHPSLLNDISSPATFQKAIETIINWSYSPKIDPHLTELARQSMAETRQSVLQGDLLACNNFDLTDHMAEIRSPTLVICGADDQMTPLRYSQFLAGSIPSAQLEVIPHAGHMVMLEQPQTVAHRLVAFLANIPYYAGQTGRASGTL
jgi:pimeloyl-ACP methyl ester carboxylesterase